jgi:cyclopropane-fatty-acyl-phospholipid synthase
MTATARALDWTEQGLIPDIMVRAGIRRLLRQRLQDIHSDDCENMAKSQEAFVQGMGSAPVALLTQKANEQHYEVPAAFFQHALGPHRKYSSAYWPPGVTDLGVAEAAGLKRTCDNAQLRNGQRILELGCGWGSLSLWMAQHYPASRITGVSNSHSQREFILAEAARRGLGNLEIITCDMNAYTTRERFDRVVSVEMFEHMRNWQTLYQRVAGWLTPGGRFFKHIFVHRSTPYLFEDADESDWMSRFFFSGGMMPSDDLPLYFQRELHLVQRQRWSGVHYAKTANAWLANLDANKDRLWPILVETYGAAAAQQWWMRWRLFFMACAELFGYDNGQQWWVSHYLFEKPAAKEGA